MIWDILEEETGARLTHSLRPRRRHGERRRRPRFKEHVRATHPARPRARRRGRGDAPQEPHLPRPPRGRRRHLRRGRDRARLDGPVPARDAASPTTCARRTRTSSTTRSTSTCRSARTATTSIASSCRLEEIRQSARIIEQALRAHGRRRARSTATTRASCSRRRRTSTRRSRPPSSTSSSMMEGIKVPAGEVLLVHRGRQRRARLLPRLRRQRHAVPRAHPSAVLRDHAAASSSSSTARMISDIVPTFGSLNMIGGECDH